MPTGVVVLGSTGSIGTQALDVIRQFPERFRVIGLAAGRNAARLAEQVREFSPLWAALADAAAATELQRSLPSGITRVVSGREGLREMVQSDEVDMVLNAIVGAEGILPTLAAIEAGKDIALANKETLVAAGAVIMAAVREHQVRLLPVDSEHSAIFQCLAAGNRQYLQRVLLTASGGPFRRYPRSALEKVTIKEALNHPTWQMGGKITIDSATLMNKGLEVIEAHWLFDVKPENITVVIHPQSIVHSLVELVDGSILAQLGPTDMRLPIQYALTYPERVPSPVQKLSLSQVGRLEFEEPDTERFPCLQLAYEALRAGGSYPAVLNAANEVAVNAFLQGEIGFMDIPRLVRDALEHHTDRDKTDIESILAADSFARQHVRKMIASLPGWR